MRDEPAEVTYPHTHPHSSTLCSIRWRSPFVSRRCRRKSFHQSDLWSFWKQFPGAVCEEGHSVSSQENRVMTGIRGGSGKGCPKVTSAPGTLSEPKRANHVQRHHGWKLRNSAPHPFNSCPESGSKCFSGRVQSSSYRTASRSTHWAWSFPHIFSYNTCAAATVQNSRAWWLGRIT